MSDAPGSVCAVIVTHNPDVGVLAEAVQAIGAQAQCVVIVDNASASDAEVARIAAEAGAELIASGTNRGVGWGHNAGIARARERGCRYALLLDQDSVAETGMVHGLCEAYETLAASDKVGAVGPCTVDAHDGGIAPFVRLGFPLNRKYRCPPGSRTFVRADFLITSGTLVPLAVLDDIGPMDEALFIDNVDMDWSFRARHRGYQLFGVCGARLLHRLGDRRLRLAGARAPGIAVHGPLRLYYMMRNRILLYRRPHTPLVWILQDVIRLPVKTFIFAALVAPRLINLQYMVKGLWHGLRGRDGAYQ